MTRKRGFGKELITLIDNFRIIYPLMIIADLNATLDDLVCCEESCAWYDAAGQCCCLLSIGQQLDKLQK